MADAIQLKTLSERVTARLHIRDPRLEWRDCGATYDVGSSLEMACHVLEAVELAIATDQTLATEESARLIERLLQLLDCDDRPRLTSAMYGR